MTIIFFIPLIIIALFESHLDVTTNRYMKNYFNAVDDGEEDDPNIQNPTVEGEEENLQISKVPFAKLIAAFPDTNRVSKNDPSHLFY